ncbi:4'-phosphopantetheinyl transferase superfamily protein [Flavobacterium piscis]|uniref:Phosphopantetheinyl transferase (Holo-ACP synthase) n=1 Tax=Flavobacterium piscis TaxID=1114874 RepID=A0ABU1YA11_9FLAO|nr:4'-phosphopantetheinyl transferase superfamily protein [Flavobacterium piscis]MDR7211062.1 phosphopantetheinyl transferase (holo-ACP synthase) [Flavobacterium piscis]
MIGNDVIDIIQSRLESNWKRKGFVEKIFTAEEQLLIAQDLNPELMVWIFWSMKEAAYKIYNRQTKIRAYIPHKLMCSLDNPASDPDMATGKVSCCNTIYYTKTVITKDYIHTIAVSDLQQWNTVTEIKKNSIIKDQDGIPFLLSSLSNSLHDVSISNHGRFEKVICISV